MPALRIMDFGGITPRLSARLLPGNGAQVAANCRLESGDMIPLRRARTVFVSAAETALLSIFRVSEDDWFASADAGVQALIKDSMVRRYIDLDNPNIPRRAATADQRGVRNRRRRDRQRPDRAGRAGVNPARRATDAAAHAHRREDDPGESARLHHRTDDPPLPRFEWRSPPPRNEQAMTPAVEAAPRTGCAQACTFGVGAFVSALSGCVVGALLVLVLLA